MARCQEGWVEFGPFHLGGDLAITSGELRWSGVVPESNRCAAELTARLR